MLLEFNTDVPGPKTHVLLIGVGGYPYLKDGTLEQEQSLELQDLGQLTLPAPSILALYKKIKAYDAQDAWNKKLGSIEILLSTPPDAEDLFPGMEIEPATLRNIQKAYSAWKNRCNQDAENVALFYYCGHGFEKRYHILLAEDFGEDSVNPWRGAFNLDDTRNAFFSCKAETQIFLVDACRQVTMEMLTADLIVPPIEFPSLLKPGESRNHLTLKATAGGASAYGRSNQPTYFSQAILYGLDGLVGRPDPNGDWIVETSELGKNIQKLYDLVDPKLYYKQLCQIESSLPSVILKRPDPPMVWLEVATNPEAALPHADLSCKEDTTAVPQTVHKRAPSPEIWRLNLKAAIYILDATFACNHYLNVSQKAALFPPFHRVNLKCQ